MASNDVRCRRASLLKCAFSVIRSRRALGRQHPYRNLETLPNWIHDTDRTVTALGTTNDLQNGATKRMKRIVNLDVRIFRAQGIVSADVSTRTYIV